jgi:hypothetical protein
MTERQWRECGVGWELYRRLYEAQAPNRRDERLCQLAMCASWGSMPGASTLVAAARAYADDPSKKNFDKILAQWQRLYPRAGGSAEEWADLCLGYLDQELHDRDCPVTADAVRDTWPYPWHGRLVRRLGRLWWEKDFQSHVLAAPAGVFSWGNGIIPATARDLYEKPVQGEFPVLADMLQDAGCSDARLLDHLRTHPRHDRGCWALDALLGKRH